MIRLVALLALSVSILSGCGARSASEVVRNVSPSPAASPSPSLPDIVTVEPTATPPPEPATATTVAGVELWCCATTVGTITQIVLRDGTGTLLVMEHPEEPTRGEQHLARLNADTQVREWTTGGAEHRTLADLETGQRVIVAFAGGIEESYPAQGSASEIEILRTVTDGPTDLDDRVIQTFVLNLYNGYGDPPPADDDFYVEYVDADGTMVQQFFCGDDPRASEDCRGFGRTYTIKEMVPRGSELSATVYRVSGAAPGTVEQGERFHVILDTDITSNAHYRYFSSDPWGFR